MSHNLDSNFQKNFYTVVLRVKSDIGDGQILFNSKTFEETLGNTPYKNPRNAEKRK